MKLKFVNNTVAECSTGGFYAKNDDGNLVDAEGKPVEVNPLMVEDLLAMRHSTAGEAMPVFELVEDADAEEPNAPDSDGSEPVTAESLVKGNSREQLEEMAKAAGLDGNTYTNKKELAEAILNSQKEN